MLHTKNSRLGSCGYLGYPDLAAPREGSGDNRNSMRRPTSSHGMYIIVHERVPIRTLEIHLSLPLRISQLGVLIDERNDSWRVYGIPRLLDMQNVRSPRRRRNDLRGN